MLDKIIYKKNKVMENKAGNLLLEVATLRNDMMNFVKKYILTGLKNKDLQEYDITFLWYDENSEPLQIVKAHSIDEDGGLFVIFEYDGKKQAEQVDVELLSFEALVSFICFYHDFIE